jgi:hypothetical protein
VVQYTPDILVYLNGDTSLPGCQTCHHNVDIQQFVTSVSVDCGVEPGASNATISLSIPKFYGDSLFRDGNTLLQIALEVHIYSRGYFPMTGMATPNARIGEVTLSDIPQYPYYPLFHGVVTSVSHEYSGGYYSASLTCNGMLHFWQHTKLSPSGSYFGSRPQNSRVRTTLTGHPFSGMTPYAIIYNLYRNTTGAAAGVGFALQSRTNFGATSSTTRDSIFSLAMRYWERRFRDRMYGLRMHGASGQMFTASQQAYLSQYRTSRQAGQFIAANLNPRVHGGDPFAADRGLLLGLSDRRDGRVLRQPDLSLLPSANGSRYGLNVTQMQAFVNDISSYGQVNLFESTYESKLDVATQVTNITGFEFYQDVDGDLVFKPPLYNLDTSSSRVYRLEPQDIISLSFSSVEPEATYVIVKAGPFANTRGLVDEAEWGVRSVYVDYRLVAQFGWREHSLETTYYNNARSAFFAGVSQLDRINAGMNSCSVTIPHRPEIRPGFPVYIPHIDCYYYVQSLSHAFSFGSQCTTTLNLIARRRKFFAPGTPSVSTGRHGVDTIDLANTALPPKPLQAVTSEGVPRLLGFPNVVMALDPTQINPQFFVYGFQVEDSVLSTGSSAQISRNRNLFLNSFIQTLISNGLLGIPNTVAPTSNPMEGPWTVQRDGFADIVLTKASLLSALGNYITVRDRSREAIPALRTRDDALRREYTSLMGRTTRTPAEDRRVEEILRERARLEADISNLQANFGTQTEQAGGFANLASSRAQVGSTLDAIRRSRGPEGVRLSTQDTEAVAVFSYLINQMRPQTSGPGFRDMAVDPTGTVNESATLLDMLNDRKASMSINTPGYYRYYSSSHPDPDQQGYEELRSGTPTSTRSNPTVPTSPSNTPIAPSAQAATLIPVAPRRSRRHPVQTPQRVIVNLGAPGSRQPRDAPVLESNVRGVHTPMEGPQVAAYLREAWRESHGGQSPSNEVLAVLTAQWAHENGQHGRGMYNFNFGGIKAAGHGNDTGWTGASVRLLTTEDQNPTHVYRNFRAYGSARDGARDYLGVLMRVHGEAVARVVQSGRAEDYVRSLRNYSTGDLEDYVRSVRSLTRAALRDWIPASMNLNRQEDTQQETTQGQGTQGSQGGDEPGTQGESQGSQDLEGVMVINATNVEGIDEERQGDLVSLSIGTPTNGLKVRTSLSPTPTVVPTHQIYTLTFEERGVPRASNIPTVVLNQGVTSAMARQAFQACLANPPQAEALARVFVAKVGPDRMGNIAQTGQELVTAAVAGISNLKSSNGQAIQSTGNISNGTPTSKAVLRGVDVSTQRVGSPDNALAILTEKAKALLVEVTLQNQEALARLNETLNQSNQGTNRSTLDSLQPLRYWTEDILLLFGSRNVPQGLPFHTEFRSHNVRDTTPTFSPVFPVSDERGYEHYGSYQYGRGLSIEPGGNYQRLMSLDPFQYTSPERVEAFVRAVRTTPLRRDTNGNLLLSSGIRESLRAIASDTDFQNSTGGQIALQWSENQVTQNGDDRASMIATGLANFVLSDRDAVTKLPVNNAAFNLVDLQPRGREDTCSCRGAEADLLLAAYMAGVNEHTFVSVDSPDVASQWSSGQMQQASVSWSLAQQAMRGVSTEQGRRSILDQVTGWQQIVSRSTTGSQAATEGARDTFEEGLRRLNEASSRIVDD